MQKQNGSAITVVGNNNWPALSHEKMCIIYNTYKVV